MSNAKQISRLKALQGVLSQTRDVICEVYGLSKEEAFTKVEAFIKENSERWRLPDPQINYEDPFCRMAYLYMNVAIHAELVERAMSLYPQIESIIQSKTDTGVDLNICALGGGPGSELLGVVRFIEGLKTNKHIAYIDFTLVDRVKEWDESWHALKAGVDAQLKIVHGDNRNLWPIAVSRSFLPLSATSVTDFDNFATRFANTDLFLICYLVSELKESTVEFEKVLNFLVARAKPGALILFIDRDQREVRETVQDIITRNPALTSLGTFNERGRSEDNLEELGEWYIHLPSLPRQKWLAFFMLAQKHSTNIS